MLYSQIWLNFFVDKHQFSLVFFLVGNFFQNGKSKNKREYCFKIFHSSNKNSQFQKELFEKIFSPDLSSDCS
jgi:hypothetical protein